VDHPNILKLRKVHISQRFLFIVTDLASGGSLKSYMRLKQITKQHLSDEECSCIVRQILEGLAHIHNLNILHRDIKPKNILVKQNKQKELEVIIADLGLGTKLIDHDYDAVTERVGTIIFMAPEQLKGNKYTTVFLYLF